MPAVLRWCRRRALPQCRQSQADCPFPTCGWLAMARCSRHWAHAPSMSSLAPSGGLCGSCAGSQWWRHRVDGCARVAGHGHVHLDVSLFPNGELPQVYAAGRCANVCGLGAIVQSPLPRSRERGVVVMVGPVAFATRRRRQALQVTRYWERSREYTCHRSGAVAPRRPCLLGVGVASPQTPKVQSC